MRFWRGEGLDRRVGFGWEDVMEVEVASGAEVGGSSRRRRR
jgi:hypothetical protein